MQHTFRPADVEQSGMELFSMLGPGLLFLFILVLALFLAVSFAAWMAVRRARRSGALKRVQGGVEKAVQGGLLKIRAESGDGVGRELAQKRLRLRRALDATARSVELFRDQQRPVGDIPAVLETLTRAGAMLDSELRLAEREPDENSQATAAAELEGQLAQIERAARDIRSTLAEAGRSLGDGDLEKDVTSRLAVESQVLKTWTQSYSASARYAGESSAETHLPVTDDRGVRP